MQLSTEETAVICSVVIAGLVSLVAKCRDCSRRKAILAEECLEISDKFRRLYHSTETPIIEIDFSASYAEYLKNPTEIQQIITKIRIGTMNQAAAVLFNTNSKPKITARLQKLLRQKFEIVLKTSFDKLSAGKTNFSTEITYVLHGTEKSFLCVASDASLVGSEAVLISLIDLTVQKEHEKKIESLAYADVLTTLPNRTFFNEQLQREVARAHRHGETLAVLFLDLDKFKNINDVYGHDYGDRVLQEVAKRFETQVRKSDTIARIGGDEFICLAPKLTSALGVSVFAEKLLTVLKKPIIVNNVEFEISTSIGISIFPDDAFEADQLIKKADIALYEAKKLGRQNYQCFSKKMQDTLVAKKTLERELVAALENDEFFFVYQPVIDLQTREIRDIEALLRWNHPTRGLLTPKAFLAVAEETGKIHEIGKWVLNETAMLLKKLEKYKETELGLTVNISDVQLKEKTFLSEVAELLKSQRIDPARLSFDISESGLVSDWTSLNYYTQQLHELGVNICLDDFGVGMASLMNLKDLHLSRVKIDISLIRSIPTEPKNSALVRGILLASEELGLEVIAEGIESEEEYEFIRKYNCKLGQGYLFGYPEALETLFRTSDSESYS